MTLSVVVVLLLTLTLVGCNCMTCEAPAVAEEEPLVVFLVRHAEKIDTSDESKLTAAGTQRAADLAHTLRSAEIEYVHSSDFARTRDTAEPTAAMFGLEVALYD